jgi:CheY-like chemotaxis protein
MRRRVLIVEDNRDAREMFRMMLELSGHQVLEAEEGCRGLELLKSELPDIAFIDVGLPGLDGYEIARRFRCESCGTYVQLVALTGYGTPDALERSHRAGFDRHLIKPVTPETLYELLNANGTGSGSENGSGISNGNGLSNGTGGAGGPSGIGSASRNAIGRDSANPAGDHGGAASARRATGGNGGGGSGAATSLAARDVSLQ